MHQDHDEDQKIYEYFRALTFARDLGGSISRNKLMVLMIKDERLRSMFETYPAMQQVFDQAREEAEKKEKGFR